MSGGEQRRARDERMVEAYNKGDTLRAIGVAENVTLERVRQILTLYQVPLRSRSYRSPRPFGPAAYKAARA